MTLKRPCRTCKTPYPIAKFHRHLDCPSCFYKLRGKKARQLRACTKILHPIIDAFLRNPPSEGVRS